MRNFRSLEAAAKRVQVVLETMHRVSENHSFGVVPRLLEDIEESCEALKQPASELRYLVEKNGRSSKIPLNLEPVRIFDSLQPAGECKPELNSLRYYRSLERCRSGNKFRAGNLVSHDCRSLRERHRRLHDVLKSLDRGQQPIDVLDHFGIEVPTATRDALKSLDRGQQLIEVLDHFRIDVPHGAREALKSLDRGQQLIEVLDHFRIDVPHVAREALKSLDRGQQLIEVLDHFGIEVSMATQDAFDDPTRHLSMFFDSYFIANGDGEVLFAGDSTSNQREYQRHRTSVPFASFAEINHLLLEQSAEPSNATPEPMPVGHSTVRTVDVNDVALSVFIHPFTIDMSPTVGRAEAAYIVGVVRRSSLTSEAIRMRLGPAVDATLAIAMLLSLLPILRFWAAGDRSISGRFNIYAVGASAVATTALGAALVYGLVTKHLDNGILDQRLSHIDQDIQASFDHDRKQTIRALKADVNFWASGIPSRPPPVNLEDHLLCPVHPPPFDPGDYLLCPVRPPPADLEDNLRCPSRTEVSRSPDNQRARLLTTLLLDNDGNMEVCAKYRKRPSQKLELAFREYFKKPRMAEFNAPSSHPDHLTHGPVFFERIDSVVQGTKEIALSFATRQGIATGEPPTQVAVAIARLQSIDDVVLPPYFEYAIIDQAGKTLFHSDEDRVTISNFIEDTGNDPAIRAAMKLRNSVILDARYDGLPIRAHIRPLHEFYDTTWTLVVYRSHDFVDRMSLLSTSLSIVSWIVIILIIVLFGVLALLAARRRGFPAMQPSTVSKVLYCKCTISVPPLLSLVGLMVAFYDRDYWGYIAAALVPIGSAATLIGAWWSTGSMGHRVVGTKRSKVGVTFTLAAIVLSLSAVPMLGHQVYFRAQLSQGLSEHLKEKAVNALRDTRERFRSYQRELTEERRQIDGGRRFLSDSMAGYDKRERRALIDCALAEDERQCIEARSLGCRPGFAEGCHDDAKSGWFFGSLGALVGYSSFSRAIMWSRSSVVGGASDVSAPTDALDTIAGSASVHPRLDVLTMSLVIVLCTLALLAFAWLCYSVMRTAFGYAERIALLPRPGPSQIAESAGSKRMLLVKQSEGALVTLIEKLKQKWCVKVANWDGATLTWKEDGGDKQLPCAYVVEDLRAATEGQRAGELVGKLRALPRGAPILLCSDVVPAYHMRPSTLDDDDKILQICGTEWRTLLQDFEVRILCSIDADSGSEKSLSNLCADVMETEARANEDLRCVASGISERMQDKTGKEDWYSDRRLREKALRRFRAMAQQKFKTQWAASSSDEKLQLIALARGGIANLRQPAAISSLANRGLITTTDPLQLRSEALAQFIKDDLSHDALDNWRRQGHHDWWRVTWLPLVVLAGLGLLFFLSSNPEAVGTLGAVAAASIGLIPIVVSLLRTGQTVQSTGTDTPTNPT